MGVALRLAGKPRESVACLVEALKVNPNYENARVEFGLSCLDAGDKQEAVRQWDLVLKMDPKNKLARTYKKLALQGKSAQ